MTSEKVLQVIETYRKFFIDMGVGKADYPHDDLLRGVEIGFEHCHGMLDKMVGFVHEGRMEKVFRWLGFIQGVLWSNRACTLTDLQNDNRPTEVTGQ
jgi:hypothetical protein